MPGVLYNPQNVGVGNAICYIAPPNTPLVADTTALFNPALWPSPWVPCGATEEGFSLNASADMTTHNIEEQSTPAAQTVNTRAMAIAASLVEDTIQTLQWSLGLTAPTIVAAASGVPGTSKAVLDDSVKQYAAALEMANTFGLARRIYIPVTVLNPNADIAFRRTSAKRQYGVSWTAVCKPSQIQIVEVTAPALP